MPGILYVVATPIGNLEDMSYRAVRVLAEADVVAAEDTRAARVLFDRYGLTRPLVSLFEGNEAARSDELLERLRGGAKVALISEAGTPGVSDPGRRLVARAAAAQIRVEPIPGASAVLAALVASGLPTDQFLFIGFPPRTSDKRRESFARLRTIDATLILFEAPGRAGATLGDLAAVLGSDQPAVLARELTKLHEEIVRGTLGALAARYAEEAPRGEVTIVTVLPGQVAGENIDVEAAVRAGLERGASPKDIAAELAVRTGKPRR